MKEENSKERLLELYKKSDALTQKIVMSMNDDMTIAEGLTVLASATEKVLEIVAIATEQKKQDVIEHYKRWFDIA